MRDPSDTPGDGDHPTIRPASTRAEPGATRPLLIQPLPVQPLLIQPLLVQPPLVRLKRRADFLHAAKGKRWHGKALSLHAAPARNPLGRDGQPIGQVIGQASGQVIGTRDGEPAVARLGFTLTKKVGNAVIRNRARRRLREAVRLSGDLPVRAGHDYVVIGRIDAVRVPFAALKREVARALGDVHGSRAGGAKPRGPRARAPDAAGPDTASPNTDKPRTIRP